MFLFTWPIVEWSALSTCQVVELGAYVMAKVPIFLHILYKKFVGSYSISMHWRLFKSHHILHFYSIWLYVVPPYSFRRDKYWSPSYRSQLVPLMSQMTDMIGTTGNKFYMGVAGVFHRLPLANLISIINQQLFSFPVRNFWHVTRPLWHGTSS